MKLVKPPKLKLFAFLFSMPLIAVVVNQVLFESRLWKDLNIWLFSVPIILLWGALSWYVHVCYDDWVEKRYPGLDEIKQRVLLKLLVLFVLMPVAVLGIFFLYDHFHVLGYALRKAHLLKGFLLGLAINLIFETLYEADYMLGQYKESNAEKQTLQELSVAQEFDTLKSQVNPHFLFNCFNTLSSLIAVDKQKAEVFLDELSKVYRYLLRNNEEGLSTVENEIKFIRSYYKLLQTRHGEAVQMNIQIDKRYDPYLLPLSVFGICWV